MVTRKKWVYNMFDTKSVWVEYCLIVWAHFFGTETSILAPTVPWIQQCLFRLIATNTSNHHRSWGIRPTCVTRVECTFWISLMFPLNSKIGHGTHTFSIAPFFKKIPKAPGLDQQNCNKAYLRKEKCPGIRRFMKKCTFPENSFFLNFNQVSKTTSA